MKVAVIGSTGYLGEQICMVLSRFPEFEVNLLAAYQNWEKLLKQAHQYRVPAIHLADPYAHSGLASEVKDTGIRVLTDKIQVREMVMSEAIQGVFFASAGIDWIELFYDLLLTDKTIWMATKEIIVSGCEIWKGKRALSSRKNLIALDSEHNAIHQLLQNRSQEEVAKIYLTASGGAFYEWQGDLNEITPEMALSHPNWKMGAKITIDSANLVNKGLEVIEANCLFGFPYAKIDVVVQRESLIHALVERTDGFVVALLSKPDMKTVILHALQPGQVQKENDTQIDFSRLKSLQFDYPVPSRFRGYFLAVEAGRRGSGYPAFFCGADEACIQAFLSHRILFNHIPILLEKALEVSVGQPTSVSDVVDIYHQGYNITKNLIQQRRSLKC